MGMSPEERNLRAQSGTLVVPADVLALEEMLDPVADLYAAGLMSCAVDEPRSHTVDDLEDRYDSDSRP